jgi:two-component system, NarL family, nitrate/nitrite response regulator NarL
MNNLAAPLWAPGPTKGLFDPGSRTIGILVVGDLPMFCLGSRTLLETQPELRVIGNTIDGAEAIKLVRARPPDILLLDLAIGPTALQILRTVQSSAPQTRTIILAAEFNRPEIIDALKLGARGIVPKDCSAELCFKAIRSVMAGQFWIGREKLVQLLQSVGKGASGCANGPLGNNFRLTPRELQIISEIVDGETNRGIAKKFGLRENTVKHHVTHIFDKVGVDNRLELALFVLQHDVLGIRPIQHTPARFRQLTLPLRGK